jgi:FMN-dependent NADH-azoreductase
MSRILLVISSPRGDLSYSTRVARSLVERLKADDRTSIVTVRDLASAPLPHIALDFVGGIAAPAEARTQTQQASLALSDELIDELLAADTLVIASAMINFGIASTLKTWIDYVVRAGRTFKYTENGAEGLVKGRKVYLVAARGGVYSDGPMKALEFQETYLRGVLGFIGLTDVESLTVEGVAFGPEAADRALSGALARIPSIAAKAA